MRRFMIACCAALLVGCAKKDGTPAADSAAMDTPAPAADITLADVAGKWTVQVAPETSDTTLLTYELNATADTSGWTLTFPGRPPIPLRIVAVAGDSIVSEAGPYESALRAGVQVWTRSVNRLNGDRLMGTTTAHYATTGADSVVNLRSRGTRAP